MARYFSLQDWPGPTIAKPNKWATFILSRNRQFKEHENRGHALNAILDTHAGILYKLDEQTLTWVEVLRIDRNPQLEACDNCDRDRNDDNVYPKRYWLDLKEEIPTLAVLCYDCYKVAKEFRMK